jgi:hypothetical protein
LAHNNNNSNNNTATANSDGTPQGRHMQNSNMATFDSRDVEWTHGVRITGVHSNTHAHNNDAGTASEGGDATKTHE